MLSGLAKPVKSDLGGEKAVRKLFSGYNFVQHLLALVLTNMLKTAKHTHANDCVYRCYYTVYYRLSKEPIQMKYILPAMRYTCLKTFNVESARQLSERRAGRVGAKLCNTGKPASAVQDFIVECVAQIENYSSYHFRV